MKKLLLLITLVLSVTLIIPPQAEANCPLIPPPGTIEIIAEPRTYKVGEAFQTTNTGIFVYADRGRYKYYGHKQLKYWANGVPITEGYKFKSPGKKTITVKYHDKTSHYEIQVFPTNLKKGVRQCHIISGNALTTYRQNIDAFDPSDIVVKCIYTNGASQNFNYSNLEFFANGKKITKGYKFKVPGKKNYTIRLGNYDIKEKLIVVPTFSKAILRYELINWNDKLHYKVGDNFHTCKYTVRCYFSDGTTQDYTGDQLDITANNVQMHDNYAFTVPGNKKMIIALGDFRKEFNLTVIK